MHLRNIISNYLTPSLKGLSLRLSNLAILDTRLCNLNDNPFRLGARYLPMILRKCILRKSIFCIRQSYVFWLWWVSVDNSDHVDFWEGRLNWAVVPWRKKNQAFKYSPTPCYQKTSTKFMEIAYLLTITEDVENRSVWNIKQTKHIFNQCLKIIE